MTSQKTGGLPMPALYIYPYIPTPSWTAGEIHRFEHKTGLSLLSYSLHDCLRLSIPVSSINSQLQTDRYGKPFLPEYPAIHFNISHCDQLIVCSLDSAPIGVDAEKIQPFPESAASKLFTDKEQQFFNQISTSRLLRQEWFVRFWTLKESYLKQIGTGLAIPMTNFSFSFDCSEHPYRIICSEPDIFFSQTRLESGHIISVCTKSPHNNIDPVKVNLPLEIL